MPEEMPVEKYRKEHRPRSSPERTMQTALITWRDGMVKIGVGKELRWLFAVPNGGERPKVEAEMMVAEGVVAGVSDLCLPAARHGYHGLYIEMKTPSGTVQPDQRDFIAFVKSEGYCVQVCRSVREAQDLLIWYLSIREDPRVLALF